jgi:hypothetical protein
MQPNSYMSTNKFKPQINSFNYLLGLRVKVNLEFLVIRQYIRNHHNHGIIDIL